MAIGLYFLVLSLEAASADLYGRSVVNLQRLTIGETFTIVGAIFFAVTWRPRYSLIPRADRRWRARALD